MLDIEDCISFVALQKDGLSAPVVLTHRIGADDRR
jgi:hypothetical protein